MKHLIIIAALLVSVLTTAQTNYEQGMQKAFDLWVGFTLLVVVILY